MGTQTLPSCDQIASDLAARYNKQPRRSGDSWQTNCPCHDDANGSLSVKGDSGNILVHCHAGCDQEAVFKKVIDISGSRNQKMESQIDRVYSYKDASGKVVLEKVRYIPKRFVIRKPDGNGGYVYKEATKDIDASLLYRLSEIKSAINDGHPIYIVEGEKDADNLAAIGLTATCNLYGASQDNKKPKWTDKNSAWLKGAHEVVIFPDNDDAGIAHAKAIASSLSGDGIKCKIIELANLPAKGDISDWLATGGTKDQLLEMAGNAEFWMQDFKETTKERSADNVGGAQVQETDNSQLALARKTIESFGEGNLIFTKSKFYQWTGKVWIECDEQEIKKRITTVCELAHSHAGQTKEITASRIEAIFKLMKSESFDPKVNFDTPIEAISCLNGELYLNGSPPDAIWELRPHRRENYRLSLIPVEYDENAKPERFIQFLDEIFLGDPDVNEKKICMCQFLGYSLTTNCRFEKFILLVGEGENGKSVLLSVVSNLVGSDNSASVDPGEFDNKFQRAYLFGKLVNIITEIRQGQEIDDGALKAITSGEPLTVEEKFMRPFTFRPYAKCWFGTNHLPHTRDTSHAFFRRPLLIEFNRKFRNANDPVREEGDAIADINLKSALLSELPGIFNFALKGLKSLQSNEGFTEPKSSADARASWRLDADQVAQFVDERCKRGTGLQIDTKLLYADYGNWAEQSGIGKPFSKKKFGQRLGVMGIKEGRRHGGTYIRKGIDLDDSKRN